MVNKASIAYMVSMPKKTTLPNKRLLQLDDGMKKRIDDFRYRERFPTESAAIRELIERGLMASAPKEPKARGRK